MNINNHFTAYRIIYPLLVLLVFTTLVGCGGENEVIQVSDPSANEAVNLDIDLILELVNSHRAAGATCGTDNLSPASAVVWNDDLANAALDHSNDMEQNDYFSHTGLDGSSFSDRVARTDYSGNASGENIAWGYPNEGAVIQGWMESQGHCINIMNSNITEIGIARSDGGRYWTMVTGRS